MVRNIPVGRPGLAAWLWSLPAPAHLPISWMWETGKSPSFHSNYWKCQCYQHSSRTKSKTQQLLGGKLTLFLLKSGQHRTDLLSINFKKSYSTNSPQRAGDQNQALNSMGFPELTARWALSKHFLKPEGWPQYS